VTRFSDRIATRYPILFGMRQAVGMGLQAIRAYKLRAGLTILGVVMGIMTVIGMSSVVAGLNASMAKQIEGLGSSVIFIRPQAPGENLSLEERRKRKSLTLAEIQTISERCPDVLAVSPLELNAASVIKYGNERVNDAQIFGTNSAYEFVHDYYVEKGRFISEQDVSRATKVAVIGADIADALFPYVDPIDKEMLMDGIRFRVVGVVERKGKFLFMNRDNVIIVPIGSMQKKDPRFNFTVADIKPVSAARMEAAIEQAREALRRARKLRFWEKDTFGIFTQDTLTDLYRQITGGIYMVMIAISSIGLVVGGVGVMNIMLVSVTERTREIGVRKALGAKRRDVLAQFLTEAMTLTGVGGVLGIVVGGGIALLVNAFSPFPAVLQPTWIVIGFLTAVGTGLVFGLWPAAKASRLDPIEALRYE
jgi:putative ABC transport system permease protein